MASSSSSSSGAGNPSEGPVLVPPPAPMVFPAGTVRVPSGSFMPLYSNIIARAPAVCVAYNPATKRICGVGGPLVSGICPAHAGSHLFVWSQEALTGGLFFAPVDEVTFQTRLGELTIGPPVPPLSSAGLSSAVSGAVSGAVVSALKQSGTAKFVSGLAPASEAHNASAIHWLTVPTMAFRANMKGQVASADEMSSILPGSFRVTLESLDQVLSHLGATCVFGFDQGIMKEFTQQHGLLVGAFIKDRKATAPAASTMTAIDRWLLQDGAAITAPFDQYLAACFCLANVCEQSIPAASSSSAAAAPPPAATAISSSALAEAAARSEAEFQAALLQEAIAAPLAASQSPSQVILSQFFLAASHEIGKVNSLARSERGFASFTGTVFISLFYYRLGDFLTRARTVATSASNPATIEARMLAACSIALLSIRRLYSEGVARMVYDVEEVRTYVHPPDCPLKGSAKALDPSASSSATSSSGDSSSSSSRPQQPSRKQGSSGAGSSQRASPRGGAGGAGSSRTPREPLSGSKRKGPSTPAPPPGFPPVCDSWKPGSASFSTASIANRNGFPTTYASEQTNWFGSTEPVLASFYTSFPSQQACATKCPVHGWKHGAFACDWLSRLTNRVEWHPDTPTWLHAENLARWAEAVATALANNEPIPTSF